MFKITLQLMEKLIFIQFHPTTRFTQDSPVFPDVWMDYFNDPDKGNVKSLSSYRADIILTPHTKSNAAELLQKISKGIEYPHDWSVKDKKGKVMMFSDEHMDTEDRLRQENTDMATSGESVVAKLTLEELVKVGLPVTNWWHNYLWLNGKPTPHLLWLKQLVGALLYAFDPKRDSGAAMTENNMLQKFMDIFDAWFKVTHTKIKNPPMYLWSVSRNRPASVSIEKSVPTTKADASRRLFDIDGSEINWAVLDTGILASHPAFRKINPQTGKPFPKAMGAVNDKLSNNTRVVATYDFTKFRDVLALIQGTRTFQGGSGDEVSLPTSNDQDQSISPVEFQNNIMDIEKDLKSGRLIDWSSIAPLLRIPHNEKQYKPPVHPHGTHVAGIIGAGYENKLNGYTLVGMCPRINLYDIRVMDDQGKGEEFNILAAIQFVRWLNSQRDTQVIHGINLSFSMIHEVSSFACGQTPVCEACERIVAEGTVVVAAAGNLGQAIYQSPSGATEQGFRIVNITDPGNAASVITVGSTHRNRPHSYGVSYFSSKGPTGDGRSKPDLVAPGEKIVSTGLKDSTERMDGTSMSAPHVSGAAALIMAKHRELIGKPGRIKDILCKSATDLGREKYFQGAGMVDVLRAIQSV